MKSSYSKNNEVQFYSLTLSLSFFRMLTEFGESSSMVVNNAGCYTTYCVELEIDGLAVTTILQSHHVQDIEGNIFTKFSPYVG